MKNAKQLKPFSTFLMIALCAIMVSMVVGSPIAMVIASAEESIYCETYSIDDSYGGGDGAGVSASYNVYYDDVDISIVSIDSAPSYKGNDKLYSNYCAPMAGMNIVAYYDRWCTELIPNYNPGGSASNGKYYYFPDVYHSEVCKVFASIYSSMKTGEMGGTSSANFKSGLNTYVKSAGYTLSYTSMYKNSTSINMDKLTTAINQGKVGLVMCDKYNYVSSITNIKDELRVQVVKINSDISHMMMVYGYKIYKYYRNGVNFQTDTFLCVSSSYGSGDQGYMKLDDYLKIDEAFIMTIS